MPRSHPDPAHLGEDDGSSANRVPLIVASPYTPAGRSSGRPLNHYSLLRASEHVLGIRRFLGEARRFSGLGYAFHLCQAGSRSGSPKRGKRSPPMKAVTSAMRSPRTVSTSITRAPKSPRSGSQT